MGDGTGMIEVWSKGLSLEPRGREGDTREREEGCLEEACGTSGLLTLD